jgi:DNA-binding transcriptional LysR family regulator
MELDLRLLRYFVAVGNELHFGRAAASLYISQPALSKQIRRLEEDLGFALLTRDSRHVALTARGRIFLDDARQMLALAERMARPQDTSVVRMAHIFEVDTSRRVVDAFLADSPHLRVVESSMDSLRQIEALVMGQLDIALIRVTANMTARYPSGWRSRLLRLEPFWLVGRPDDPPADRVSLRERAVEVFADTADSPTYNAHGQYMTALEKQTGVTLTWLGNPGTYDHCLTVLRRSSHQAYLLEFESYAQRYAKDGLPIYRPAELQPVYPWSIAWRDEAPTEAVARFVRVALAQAHREAWLEGSPGMAPLWSPAEDPTGDRDGLATSLDA